MLQQKSDADDRLVDALRNEVQVSGEKMLTHILRTYIRRAERPREIEGHMGRQHILYALGGRGT